MRRRLSLVPRRPPGETFAQDRLAARQTWSEADEARLRDLLRAESAPVAPGDLPARIVRAATARPQVPAGRYDQGLPVLADVPPVPQRAGLRAGRLAAFGALAAALAVAVLSLPVRQAHDPAPGPSPVVARAGSTMALRAPAVSPVPLVAARSAPVRHLAPARPAPAGIVPAGTALAELAPAPVVEPAPAAAAVTPVTDPAPAPGPLVGPPDSMAPHPGAHGIMGPVLPQGMGFAGGSYPGDFGSVGTAGPPPAGPHP